MTLKRYIAMLLLLATPILGTEFRSVSSTGVDAESIGVGNVTSFGSSALSILDTPALRVESDTEVSVYYATLMEGDVSLLASGFHKQLTSGLSMGVGVVHEAVDGGYETASSNSEVTAIGELTYTNTEYVVNGSYRFTEAFIMGVSGQYMVRDAFGIEGHGVGLSFGGRYEGDRVGVAFGVENLNSPTIEYTNEGEEEVYATWYAGVKRRLGTVLPVVVYGQYNWVPDASSSYAVGGVRVSLSDHLDLSGGYMQTRGIGNELSGHVTVGASLKLPGSTLHYVYSTSDYVASPTQHRVSVSFKF